MVISTYSQLSVWRQFLAMFCAFGSAVAYERESVCSSCQSLHSSHLPYAPWICAHLQLVVQDAAWLDGTVSNASGRRRGELLKYKLPFFCTMRQPLKNLCRLQICQLYQVKYTIVAFMCYFLPGNVIRKCKISFHRWYTDLVVLLYPALNVWPRHNCLSYEK